MDRRILQGATVLVTGGTGSFGSTMVRQLLQRDIAEVRVFSRDEAKQDLLRHQLRDSRVKYFLGDTRDKDSLRRAVKGASLVYQAAALKQVPSAEFFPLEAVKTNVNGSANVISLSIEYGVKSVVCLSTDKAVYPINAMGMSKALMEKTAQAFARDFQDSETTISITRYGNVMYSRGSVIPLFIRQIREGGPITITDASMTRFLMSLEESVDLVEHAYAHAKTGDLFVKKAPATRLDTLAQALQELMETSVDIRYIGFRHGEKLYESLLSSEERYKGSDEGDYFRVGMDSRNLEYSDYFEEGQRRDPGLEAFTSHNTVQLGVREVKELLLSLPEIQRDLSA